MLVRTPSSVGGPPSRRTESRSLAVVSTSSRVRWIWSGRSPRTASKTSRQVGTRPGWATQEPSKPSSASRSLSSRTLARAAAFASGSLLGTWAVMPPMAWAPRLWQSADEEFGVRPHEGGGHGDLRPVGEEEVGAVAEGLDQTEQVVPAACVEPGAVLAELVEDFLHLERGGDRLDEDRGADRAARDAEKLLGKEEHVVPQACLVGVLQLRQVEVRARPASICRWAQWKKYRPEVDEGRRHGSAVELQVVLLQVPPAGPDHDRRRVRTEAVLLALGAGEVDTPLDRVEQHELPADHVPQVGEVASSKSAIQTRAPELSALTAIPRSAGGPVISTRRSARPGAGGAARQEGSCRTAEVVRGSRGACRWRAGSPAGVAPSGSSPCAR